MNDGSAEGSGNFNILVFNWRCWLNPEAGGAEVFTREVLKRWAKMGHEVTLFTSCFKGSKKEESKDGIRIIREGGKYSVYWKAPQIYKKRFSKEGYDVVVDEINTIPFLTPRFVRNGEKIISLIHQLAKEYWFYETPFPINFLGYYYLEEKLLKNYTKIPTVTVSNSTRKDLIELNFEEIHVVGEGLNFEPLSKVSEKEIHPVIVYAGRLKRAKRPDHAIQAFNILRKTVPEAELWIIGDGPFRKELMKNACKNVRFFGVLTNRERRDLIKKSWVLVNPSVREGFGLNIVEANALGVPSVAYDVPGLRDSVKDGETGFLVRSGETNALAKAVARILTNDALRTRLSERALAYSRGFSWEKVAKEFISVVETVLQEGLCYN